MDIINKGWSLSTHHLEDDKMNSLVNKKNEILDIACYEVKKAFNIDFNKFEPEKVEQIELAKAITRSLLRYEKNSILLAKSISKNIRKRYQLDQELEYCTLPYPIIHFPNDTSEIGSNHRDTHDYVNPFYTTWTPLNDCYSKPLAITEGSHKKKEFFLIYGLRFLFKSIDSLFSIGKSIVNPDIKIGEYLIWDGKTYHKGLLNKTSAPTVSLVIRFTKSPILHERTATLNELEQYQGDNISYDIRSLTRKFILIYKEIKSLNETFSKKTRPINQLYEEVQQQIDNWKLQEHEKEKLSFILTLLAQRLEGKRSVFVLYLYSIVFYQNSLYGLQKVVSFSLKHFDISETEKFIRNFLQKNNSKQAVYSIKNALKWKPSLLSRLKLTDDSLLLKWTASF